LRLLANLKNATPEEQEKQRKAIVEIIAGDTNLRSKKELIEKFIQENLAIIEDSEDIPDEFLSFWDKEKQLAFEQLSKEENLDISKLEKVIGDYIFTEKVPLRDDVVAMINEKPALKERRSTAERITDKIVSFIETFISGIGGGK
jgi:type I restriction enzyme R subunit